MFVSLAVTGIFTQVGCTSRKTELHEVAIKEFQYAPATLSVRSGDTISWTNQDVVPHTATGETPGLDSGSMDTGKVWRYVALTKGSYSYKCAFHPTMAGTFEVR
ncbi:MAG: plastocyanin/azurin family copper-binding protein [Verrucomicrobiota bacterium]|nr:plastocyanin/azurin family copper-binding protein [Verrucomicrobiota bacterium]